MEYVYILMLSCFVADEPWRGSRFLVFFSNQTTFWCSPMSKLQTANILCGNEPIVFATGYVLNTKYDSVGKLDILWADIYFPKYIPLKSDRKLGRLGASSCKTE